MVAFVGLEKGRLAGLVSSRCCFLGTFSSDPPGQLDVLGHDGDTLGVDGAQVGVLEQTHEVGLRCFLKGERESFVKTTKQNQNLSARRLPGWLCQNCPQVK